MNIKTSVAAVLLAASVGVVSACGSSTDKSASPPPAGTVPTATTAPTSAAASAPGAPAATATATAGTAPTASTAASAPAAAHGDIPDAALLSTADLAAAQSGKWSATAAQASVKASDSVDPDNCDPTPRPQDVDPGYPRNPAWVNTRTAMWTGSGQAGQAAQVSETVVTYKSAADAAADYGKHQGWVAACAAHFQWTDAPQKFAVSPVPLPGVPGAYAIHVGMYGGNEPASAAGSQGYDYMAVVLRGNTLTVLNVSQTALDGPKPSDPGPAGFQHDVQAAADALAIVYEA